ncbi:nitroreductase family protein [Desulforhopalus singaporensis]|uniref:nitroreductase family protein n=1 Tax=Desulforhopalus singaporensis TaxID=91360 RepID=UPI000B843614
MSVGEALMRRKSTRAFLKKEVEREKIINILNAARHAPSGTNAQPWHVAVVSGKLKKSMTQEMQQQFEQKGAGEMDYNYYPNDWKEPYRKRRVECGAALYSALNIERRDRAGRLRQWQANYRAFDAPVILFFFIDPIMEKGSFLDYGMFIQSVMLAAVEQGLATCAQAALGQYPELVKKTLGYPQETILICGMALGYEDPGAPVNNYRTTRIEVEKFTTFLE